MRRAMDAFGSALQAYAKGAREPFYFIDKAGNAYEHPLSRYFRGPKEFTRIEKRMIGLSRGRILDVGCGTGTHLPSLSRRGIALGVDISSKAIRLAKARGNKNCRVADIYAFSPRSKFDTIVLFENNIGMAGTRHGARRLLEKLASILAPDGRILTNANLAEDRCFTAELTPRYNDEKGHAFKWMHFDEKTLKGLCGTAGLTAEIIDRERKECLIQLKKRTRTRRENEKR